MAKIKTLQLREYLDFLVKNKDTSRLTYECVYLDFKSKVVRMYTTRWVAQLALDVEFEPNEVPINFWVRVDDFARLVIEYKELLIKDKTFSVGNDRFTFAAIDEAFPEDNFIRTGTEQVIDLSEKTLEAISAASGFMSIDPQSSLNGVFLKGNRVIATDQRRFYEETTDQNELDLNLPSLLVSFMVSHKLLRSHLVQDGFTYRLEVDEIFTLQTVVQESLEIINTEDPEFVKMFNHPNRFVLPKDETLNILKFLDHFTSSTNNNAISILFIEDRVCFSLSGEREIERYLTLETSTPDYFKNQSFRINQKMLQKIITYIKSSHVQVQINFDLNFPALNFFGTGDNENKLHVICGRLEG